MLRLVPLLTATAVTVMMTSCASMHHKLKPKAVAPSAFLTHPAEMKAEPQRSPFLLNWTNPKPRAKAKTKLFIAPVSLATLRPMSKRLANTESSDRAWMLGAKTLADYAHEQFTAAFRSAQKNRYELQSTPAKDTQTLELAIVELNPNTISGAVVRNGVNAVALPGTDLIFAKAARPLKGNIAIEGRLRDSQTGEPLFEFADNEESKSALIINVRDFTTYGQARLAIREWAAQLEQLLSTPGSIRVKDSSPVTFRLW